MTYKGFGQQPVKGVQVQGEARVISQKTEFRELRKLLYRKYTQYERESPVEEGESVFVEVIPQHVVSWGL